MASLNALLVALLASLGYSSPGLPGVKCLSAFKSISQLGAPLNVTVLAQFALATGKDLPFDSGKYAMCQNIEQMTGNTIPAKFLVLTFAFPAGKAMFPGEVGVCVPAACADADFTTIQMILSMHAGPVGAIAKSMKSIPGAYDMPNPFNNQDNRLPWGRGTSAGLVVLALLLVMVVGSTLVVTTCLRQAAARQLQQVEAGFLQDPQQQPQQMQMPRGFGIFEAFSIIGPSGTWTSLWKADARRPTDCLNGFRVLSMLFIILGHGMEEPMNIAGYSNKECLAKTPFCVDAASTNMWQWFMMTGQLGVDTFFFIGGFLLSFVGKSRPVPILLGSLLRYLRLVPLLGLVTMVYILIAPYLVFGPFAPRFQSEVDYECGHNNSWWSQLLLINSFYPWFPVDGGCMGWTWYLGSDMLFAILGMVLLNLWKKLPRIAWVLAIASFFACIAACIQQSLYYGFQYNLLSKEFALYGTHLYSRPYSRFPCFIIGLVAPWALDIAEKRGLQRGTQPRTWFARTIVLTSCLMALFVAAVCIFLPWTNSDGPGPYANADGSCSFPGGCARPSLQWTPWENALWISLSRPAWCLCWLTWTMACYFDYLPCINAVFAAPVFTPLSTLTFGAYLCHPVIVKICAGNYDGYLTYTIGEALQRAIMFTILAYSAAIVAWCLVEKPCATLTGWLVPKKGKAPVAKPTSPLSSGVAGSIEA